MQSKMIYGGKPSSLMNSRGAKDEPSMPGGRHEAKEERIFVQFFIPPPPPLASASSSSDSDETTNTNGFDVVGIGKRQDILELSSMVVNNTGRKKGKKSKNSKAIVMDSSLFDSDGSSLNESSSSHSSAMNLNSMGNTTEINDVERAPRRIRRESSISILSGSFSDRPVSSGAQGDHLSSSSTYSDGDMHVHPIPSKHHTSISNNVVPPLTSTEVKLINPLQHEMPQEDIDAISSSIDDPNSIVQVESHQESFNEGSGSSLEGKKSQLSPPPPLLASPSKEKEMVHSSHNRLYHFISSSSSDEETKPIISSPMNRNRSFRITEGEKTALPQVQEELHKRVCSPLSHNIRDEADKSPKKTISDGQQLLQVLSKSQDMSPEVSRSPRSPPTNMSSKPTSPQDAGMIPALDDLDFILSEDHDEGDEKIRSAHSVRERSKNAGEKHTPIADLLNSPVQEREASPRVNLVDSHEKPSDVTSKNNRYKESESSSSSEEPNSVNNSPRDWRIDIVNTNNVEKFMASHLIEHEHSESSASDEREMKDKSEGSEGSEGSEDEMADNQGKKLRRVKRFFKDSIVIDKEKELIQCIKNNDYDRIVDISNELVASLKVNRNIVNELDIDETFSVVRSLMVMNNTYIRCSALRLLRYICINDITTQIMFAYKMNIFIIMSLERSDKLSYERHNALSLISYLIDNFTQFIPRSLVLSILCVANDATDPLRTSCLKLVLQLLIHVPSSVIYCDGVQVLLNGCVETNNCSLLQSSILTCLYHMNSAEYRQKKTILDLQIILDPLLVETKSVTEDKLGELQESRYMANMATLTILRTWSGLFIFGGDFNGLNSYLNILISHGDEEPELVKQMLSVLFTAIGIPTPSLIDEEDRDKNTSIFWNNCSLFISSISESNSTNSRSSSYNTNLLTSYLSLLVWTLLNSKLPEILSSLMVSLNAEVALLSKRLLQNLIHLSSVFVCMSDLTTAKTAQQAMLSFKSNSEQSSNDLQRMAKARDCFVDIGSTSTLLYPIVESSTFVDSNLTDLFSSFSLFHCIMDCFCDNTRYDQPLAFYDYICDEGIPFQKFVSSTFPLIYQNQQYFSYLTKLVKKDFEEPMAKWNFTRLLECMLMAASSRDYNRQFISTNIIYHLQSVFTGFPDRPEMGIANMPINSDSPVYAACLALWMIILISSDNSQITLQRKTKLFKYYNDQILNQLDNAKLYKNSGLFCLYNLKYTNSYYYLVIFLRFLYSKRCENYTSGCNVALYIERLSKQEHYPQSNIFIVREIIQYIVIKQESNSKSREIFADFLKYGHNSIKMLCLSRIKCAFKEMPMDRPFSEWAIPLLVNQISIVSTITTFIVDILYENTTIPDNLICLIKALKNNKSTVNLLARLSEAKNLIYRVITNSEGFSIFEECDSYVTQEFHNYMRHYLELYVYDIEDGMAARLMRDPNISSSSIIIDGEKQLLATPLKVQPPSHIVFNYLRQDQRRLEWFYSIPWRIEVELISGDKKTVIDVDTQINISDRTSTNVISREDISIEGVLFDADTHEEKQLKIPSGSTLRAYLFVGTECVKQTSYCSDIAKREMGDYEKYVEKKRSATKKSYDENATSDTQRASIIKEYMMENPANDYQEVSYMDIAPRLESVVNTGRSDTTFGYCKNDECCYWKFVVSEGDFKATDMMLGRTFSLHSVSFIIDFIPHKPASFTPPHHLFGSLFPTVAGRTLLRDGLQFGEMCYLLTDTKEKLSSRRSILWGLAHIAVLPKGTQFIKTQGKIDFIKTVVGMVESDRSLVMRGSCFLVLSFLASNPDLRPLIQQENWSCDASNNNSICLPCSFDRFYTNIVCSENWLLPVCNHFNPAKNVKKRKSAMESTQSISDSFSHITSSVLKRSSTLSMLNAVTTSTMSDSSAGSSGKTIRGSIQSSDSRGASVSSSVKKQSNFDDVAQHYLRSNECPSDVVLDNVVFQKEIIDLIHVIALLNSTVYSFEARLRIEDLKRKKPYIFQSPLSLLCIHHMFSLSLFPRGWRKFVFQLFDDIQWDADNWRDFDMCSNHDSDKSPKNLNATSDEEDVVNVVVMNNVASEYEGITSGFSNATADSMHQFPSRSSYSNSLSNSNGGSSLNRSPALHSPANGMNYSMK